MTHNWAVAGAAIAFAGLIVIAWQLRIRARKRRLAVWEGYADREIERERRVKSDFLLVHVESSLRRTTM